MRRVAVYHACFKLIDEKIRHDKMRTGLTVAHRGRLDANARRLIEVREFLTNDPVLLAALMRFTPETTEQLLQEIAQYEGPKK